MTVLAQMPVPRDIPLPLPADTVLLQGLAVMLFLAHILFVNLLVGGALIGLGVEAAGLRHPRFRVLAREIAKTITVNKSLAVVLGVGPLLVVNVLYTVHFYSANALTGMAWIAIVPLVSIAFLLAYAHKYSWDRLANVPRLHLALGAAATLLFVLIPFIFLANINLMLFPARWTEVKGFLSTLLLPNVMPRYAHFLLACISVAALFLLGYFTRRGYPVERVFAGWDRRALRRAFYRVALVATCAQLIAGPVVYFTLPPEGRSWFLAGVIGLGAVLAVAAIALMMMEFVSAPKRIGRFYTAAVTLIMLTACCMAYGRHVYREGALLEHRRLVARRTDDFKWFTAAAALEAESGSLDPYAGMPLGEQVFRRVCAGCHAVNQTVVGPPLTEIAQLYTGNPAGIVSWTKNPGRRRADVAPMPAFRFPPEELEAVAEYMLDAGAGGPAEGERAEVKDAP